MHVKPFKIHDVFCTFSVNFHPPPHLHPHRPYSPPRLLHPCTYKQIYCQTYIKRSPLGQRKTDLIRQVTSLKRSNSNKMFYDRTRQKVTFKYRWLLNRGDHMGRFDCICIYTYMYIMETLLTQTQQYV